jgi:ASCH domain
MFQECAPNSFHLPSRLAERHAPNRYRHSRLQVTFPKQALSVRQPWAYAILHGGKNIENRTWPTQLRGTIAIHAGRTMEPNDIDEFFRFLDERRLSGTWLTRAAVESLPRGAVVGTVDIVGCVRESDSPWFEGPFGFVLENPRPVIPVACRGSQKFFDLPVEVLSALALPA